MEHIILEILCVLRNSHDRIFINTHNLSVTYHSFLRLFYIHTINHTYRSHIGIHISLASVYKINIVRLSYYITFTRYYVVFVRTSDVQTATFKQLRSNYVKRHVILQISAAQKTKKEKGGKREKYSSRRFQVRFHGSWKARPRVSSSLMKISKLPAHREFVISRDVRRRTRSSCPSLQPVFRWPRGRRSHETLSFEELSSNQAKRKTERKEPVSLLN